MVDDVTMAWNKDHTKMEYSMKLKGFKTKGQVSLKPNKISLEGKLPFAARLFKGKIEGMIKQQLEDLFS